MGAARMKRVPLPPRRSRLARGGKLKVKGGHRFKGYVPNPAYQRAVRARGCIVAGRKGHVCSGIIEFMHVRAKARGGYDECNGLPGCTGTHQTDTIAWHRGEKTWQRHYGINAKAEAQRIGADWFQAQQHTPENGR